MCDDCAMDKSKSWEVCDVMGVYLTRVCESCHKESLERFRPGILEPEDQKAVYGKVIADCDPYDPDAPDY